MNTRWPSGNPPQAYLRWLQNQPEWILDRDYDSVRIFYGAVLAEDHADAIRQ